MGGKGGFGSLLRSQKGGKKTKNFDACRDTSGRRVRHAKVIERLTEWLKKKKQKDEIVKNITKDIDKSFNNPDVKLDKSFIKDMKERARKMEDLVKQGMLFEKERQAGSKRKQNTDSMKEKKKYKKLFFNFEVDFSDNEDSDIESMNEEALFDQSETIKRGNKIIYSLPTNDNDEDSEDDNSDIDDFFDINGDINESKINEFFIDSEGAIDASKVSLFMVAKTKAMIIDAEKALKKQKNN